jgi:hypothetical protein
VTQFELWGPGCREDGPVRGEALPRPAPTDLVREAPRPVARAGRKVCRLIVMIDHIFPIVNIQLLENSFAR